MVRSIVIGNGKEDEYEKKYCEEIGSSMSNGSGCYRRRVDASQCKI